MEYRDFYKSLLILIGLVFLSFVAIQKNNDKSPFTPPLFIAHASGGINGLTYLNSLEALNHNYNLGHRYFEVDFSWTSDNELVLIHDWKFSYNRLFNIVTEKAPTLNEFLKMKMAYNQTQLSLSQFAKWMRKHPEAILVADIKSDNIKGLKKMLETIDNPHQRIIPQLYKIKNFNKILKLGFKEKHIMFTMYKTMKLNSEILEFIKTEELFAISIQPQKKYFHKVLSEIGQSSTPIYTLTINDLKRFNEYKLLGLDGTVTDYLYTNDGIIKSQDDFLK